MLNPSVIGVAFGREAEFPADIVGEMFLAPVGDVEGRVGENEIGSQILEFVVVEGIAALNAGVDGADGHIHFGEAPGSFVEFLAVDGDVADTAGVFADEIFGLDEHTAAAAAGVVDFATVRLEHLHEEADDGAWGVEFAAVFALAVGEHTHKIFVDAAEEVAGVVGLEGDVGEEVDEFAEAAFVEGFAGVIFG